MKRLMLSLLIMSFCFLLSGCIEPEPIYSTVIGRIDDVLYIKNHGNIKNDSEVWTTLDLNKDTTSDFREQAIEMDFKSGDEIVFIGMGCSGWHDVSLITIVKTK